MIQREAQAEIQREAQAEIQRGSNFQKKSNFAFSFLIFQNQILHVFGFIEVLLAIQQEVIFKLI